MAMGGGLCPPPMDPDPTNQELNTTSARILPPRLKTQSGLTLIELLVVVLFIAILAARAIPVFLAQKRKAWEAEAQATLKSGAVAEESYAAGPGRGSYTMDDPDFNTLKVEGFRYPATDVAFTINDVGSGSAMGDSYCLEADFRHDPTVDWKYSSEDGAPQEGECP